MSRYGRGLHSRSERVTKDSPRINIIIKYEICNRFEPAETYIMVF